MIETGEFTFVTSKGRTRVVRIPDPVPAVTQALQDSVRDKLIAANPFNEETVGNLLALKHARRVNVERFMLLG